MMKKMLIFITVLTCFAIANSTALKAKHPALVKITQQITKVQNKVRKLDRDIKNMRGKIAAENRKWKQMSKFKRALHSAKHGINLARLNIALGGLKTSRKMALGMLNALKKIKREAPEKIKQAKEKEVKTN